MALDQDKLNALKLDKASRYERKNSKAGKWIGLMVIIALVTVGVYWFSQTQSTELPRVETYTVQKPTANSVPISDAILNASGYVVARRQATVSSKVTGKILAVNVEEGMQVQEGDILAVLDDSTLVAQISLAQSQQNSAEQALKEIQVRIDEAATSLKRTLSLRERQLVAASAVDSAQSELAALQARLLKARSDIRVSAMNLALQKQYQSDYTIVAPFNGVVISKNAQPGEMISPAATGGSTRTGICTIVDMDSREIEVDVNESFINKVEAGQVVEAVLDAYPKWSIPASVINIVPTADRQKATVKVRIGFDQLDPRILIDMGVKVTFLSDASYQPVTQSEKTAELRIPLNVIFVDSGIEKVLQVDIDGKVTIREIELAARTLNNATVQSGLAGGEVLILDPEQYKDQTQVLFK